MIQCLGCGRKCRKLFTENTNIFDKLKDVCDHKCSNEENKSFSVKHLNNRKIRSRFLLTRRDIEDIF
jgi:hypothetical protein